MIDSSAACLGVLYVLEGATLGGQILRREVAKRLGIEADSGAGFLHVYGDATGRRWRYFIEYLGSRSNSAVSSTGSKVARYCMPLQDKKVFEELLDNCANEPIRFPGAIQPHGLLLTLSEPALEIIQVSANVETLLGRAPQALIGQSLPSLLGDEYTADVCEALQQPAFFDAPPLYFQLNGTAFEGLLHRHEGVLILELEIHVENFQSLNIAGNQTHLGRMLQRLQAATSLQVLYDICVKEVQAMTGYDRVLIYRFEEEGHGQVIAEASSPSMELFNGLFFPASDIPEQARELYRTNWLRIIPNADYEPVPLVPKLRPDTGTRLDLSFATLRSVSPIHCQYMKNMGVLSSMSISLLKGDKLWGLISCGNRQPLHVPHELRIACQTIGQVLSLQISAMEALEVSRQREEKVEALAVLNQAMIDSPQNVFEGLANQSQALMALVNAGGIAIIEDKQLHCYGNCPSPQEIRALHQWWQASGEPVGVRQPSSVQCLPTCCGLSAGGQRCARHESAQAGGKRRAVVPARGQGQHQLER